MQKYKISSVVRKHLAPVSAICLLNNNVLISGDQEGKVTCWDVKTSEECGQLHYASSCQQESILHILNDGNTCSQMNTNGKSSSCSNKIVIQSRFGTLSLWDIEHSPHCAISVHRTKASSFGRACLIDSSLHCDTNNSSLSGISNDAILCLTPSPLDNGVYLIDVNRTPVREVQNQCVPVIHFGSLKWDNFPKNFAPNIDKSNNMLSPTGFVVGIQPLPILGSTYVIVAYEAFGTQAIYDLRQPKLPIATPAFSTTLTESVTSFATKTYNSWIGTSDGLIQYSTIDINGNIQYNSESLDLFSSLRMKHRPTVEDHCLLREEARESLHSKMKFGVGALAVDYKNDNSYCLICGCWDGKLRIADPCIPKIHQTLNFHSDSIMSIACNSTSQYFGASSKDTRISLWKLIYC